MKTRSQEGKRLQLGTKTSRTAVYRFAILICSYQQGDLVVREVYVHLRFKLRSSLGGPSSVISLIASATRSLVSPVVLLGLCLKRKRPIDLLWSRLSRSLRERHLRP